MPAAVEDWEPMFDTPVTLASIMALDRWNGNKPIAHNCHFDRGGANYLMTIAPAAVELFWRGARGTANGLTIRFGYIPPEEHTNEKVVVTDAAPALSRAVLEGAHA